MNTELKIGEEIIAGRQISYGLPSASFIQAKKYTLIEVSDLLQVQLPKKGFFSSEEGAPFRGEEFNICPEPGTILFGDMLKVLISLKAYPQLRDNQVFTLSAIAETADCVNVVGRILEIVEE